VILDALQIAGIECTALVNSTTAAALTYTMNNISRLPPASESPLPILFIDFGDLSMNASVCTVSREKVTVLSFASDEDLGGFHFTNVLFRYLIEKVQKSHGYDPLQKVRSRLKFWKSTETVKHNLSVNPVVQFELPDADINFPVKREEFESQLPPLLSRIAGPVESALSLANITKDALFAVEVQGGASRVPAVKTELQRVLDRDPGQSLDIDECFAIGSGYLSAILSPSFRIPMALTDALPYPLFAEWPSSARTEAFPAFATLGSESELFVNASPITFSDPHGPIGTVVLPDGIVEATLHLRLSPQSLLEVSGAGIVYQRTLGLQPGELAECRRDEGRLAFRDAGEIAIDNSRNELESLLFEIENAVERDATEFFGPEELESARHATAEVREWFGEHESERMTEREYRERSTTLRATAGRAMDRRRAVRLILDEENTLRGRATQLRERAKAVGAIEADASIVEIVDELDRRVNIAKENPHLADFWMNGANLKDGLTEVEAQITAAENAKKKGRRCTVE
jgi:molecular chaperone DnaK (HSP70)